MAINNEKTNYSNVTFSSLAASNTIHQEKNYVNEFICH